MNGGMAFVLGIMLISTTGWLVNNWIRARHGFEPETEDGDRPSRKQINAVTAENDALKAQVKKLEERMAVMERIATDPAERTAREIENLR